MNERARHRLIKVSPVEIVKPARGDLWVDREDGRAVEILRASGTPGSEVVYWYPIAVPIKATVEAFVEDFRYSERGWWLP